ncbi:serine hydrolase domain-containing protein [Roseibaca sp. Y0-43]|uniref:serine hydrolase domain-containing protein n=1 Tax=Roseibaca sp. Y0-43 TaxID=2816854 RepID=UPI001DFF885A|nr:serine hydrolase domain-containing protein [Roseibaca sp. Y0-43]MCC1480778.1 beta-lactamase family protein [Roseibaca sp. Y0-43]
MPVLNFRRVPRRTTNNWSSVCVLAFCLVTTNVFAQGSGFAPCAEGTTAPAPLAKALDGFLVSLVDPDAPLSSLRGYGSAAVLSVIGPDWRYVRATGVAAPGSDEPISCETPFQVGSATKMMTATVLLQLHEEGALSIDDLLSTHLAETASALPNGDVITLRQLANHTAGVFSYTDNAPQRHARADGGCRLGQRHDERWLHARRSGRVRTCTPAALFRARRGRRLVLQQHRLCPHGPDH